MKKAKKYILLLIGIAGIFVFSVAYHNHLVRKAVLEDTNSERFYQESEENIEKKTKLEVMSGSYSNLSNETCAWGFVRKPNGQQPEFYGPHAKVLDENQGIYIGNKDEKILYLTFDEGYENGYTASILDTLKDKAVTAAFFVTMPYVKQNPDLIKRMIAEGHIVRKSYSESSKHAISNRE